jgi:hypothetical protein
MTAGQERHGKRRGHRERHHERGQYGQGIRERKGSKQSTGNPGQRHDRQHHQDNRKGGVEDGASDFEAGVQHDARDRPRLRQTAVFPQPPDDILDIDDGIIDDDADRDRKAAQGHRVERHSQSFQHGRGSH